MKGSVYVGTSGWNFKEWRGRFYPAGVGPSKWLGYISERLNTVEINSSFYAIPKPEVVSRWAASVPEGFRFSIKLWRAITHYRRLRGAVHHIERFFDSAERLSPRKRGPLLVQLPPGMKRDEARLNSFFDDLQEVVPKGWKVVIEFRDESWICPEVYRLLDRRKASICLHDMPGLMTVTEPNNSRIVYVRRHGTGGKYWGSYERSQMESDAAVIQKWAGEGRTVYVYFNNDIGGHAVVNAQELRTMLR